MLRIVVLLLAVWLTPAATAFGASHGDPAAVAQQFFDATNRRDIAAMLALVTDDHLHEGGPCFMQPCVGKAAFQQALERIGAAGLPAIRTLSTEVSGTTVTVRNEVRPPFLPEPLRAQGVERLIEIETVELRGDKIAVVRSVPDASDPQTARALALFASGPPPARPASPVQAPSALPRTGGTPLASLGLALIAGGAGLLGLGLARRGRRSQT